MARLALIGNLSAEEFRDRFEYLTYDPPVRREEPRAAAAADKP